jgi:hypothetical protein
LFAALLLLTVSYSRDIAPIFALHCNSCHGDAGMAGGLATRTHADLLKADEAIVPGNPDRSQVVQFIEGRRGEEHRMPLGGAPLTVEQITLIRRWIAEGAKSDAGVPVTYKFAIPKVRARQPGPLRIECSVPLQGYLILKVRSGGRVLYERRFPVKSPKDRGDAGVPGETMSFTIWPEKGWPAVVRVELSVLYTESEPRGVILRVKS